VSFDALRLTSLDPTVRELVHQLGAKRDSALIAAPGCGSTTLLQRIRAGIAECGGEVIDFDLAGTKTIAGPINRLNQVPTSEADVRRVLIIDHASSLSPEDLRQWFDAVQKSSPRIAANYLWVGQLDARAIERDLGVHLHTIPRCHMTFPVLPRHEVLAVYRSIAEAHGCRWGEAILFLLVDFCGNDFALAESATEYFYGDWSSKLYDATVWDRVNDWFAHSQRIQGYRSALKSLPETCKPYLALLRLGGKPVCPRTELREEVDDALRTLCLQGVLVQNLLPGFYQIRNLTVRYLVQEGFANWDRYKPEMLFRRVTNERVSQLLQDVESMLRYVLLSVFEILGDNRVQEVLTGKQGEGEFISAALNKALLELAEKNGGQDLKQAFNSLITEHRKSFKESNSVWQRVGKLMEQDDEEEAEATALPKHLRAVEYLTFSELADIFVQLIPEVFPATAGNGNLRNTLSTNWREALARVRRLRNRVAHLRNVEFQDMEDLVGTVEAMRKDIISYCAWR
jgi:hypothetical protein